MATESAVVRALDLVIQGVPRGPRLKEAGLEAADRTEAADQAADMRRVLGSKNVVGIGVAEKMRRGKSHGELALTFYVIKKIKDKRRLRGHEVVPPTVPLALTGGKPVPTDVVVLGRL